MTKTLKIKWTGSSDKANLLFGENYGADWKYSALTGDVLVDDIIIKIGDTIEYEVTIKNIL